MSKTTTSTAAGMILDANLDQLQREINNAHPTVMCVGISAPRGRDINGNVDETRDQVIATCEGDQLSVAALDAVIADHPTITPGATGSFAVVANTSYLLGEETLEIGDNIVLDVHVHAALGLLANSDATWADWYVVAWRQGNGSIKFAGGGQPVTGTIPGLQISVVSTATTVQVRLTTRKSGTLTLFANSVEVESRGRLT